MQAGGKCVCRVICTGAIISIPKEDAEMQLPCMFKDTQTKEDDQIAGKGNAARRA